MVSEATYMLNGSTYVVNEATYMINGATHLHKHINKGRISMYFVIGYHQRQGHRHGYICYQTYHLNKKEEKTMLYKHNLALAIVYFIVYTQLQSLPYERI